MKTIDSRKAIINKIALLKGLGAAFTMAAALSAASITAHAELVDETDEWTQEGQPTYEDITQEEQDEHTQENIERQEQGEEGPAPQDAEAVVDNSQGGEKPSEEPQPAENVGPSPEQRAEEAKPEDVHPKAGLEDEYDQKTEGDTPDKPTPDNPTPDNPTPEQPEPEQPQPQPEQPQQEVPAQPVITEQKIKKMGLEGFDPGFVAELAGVLGSMGLTIGGTAYKVKHSRKGFRRSSRRK